MSEHSERSEPKNTGARERSDKHGGEELFHPPTSELRLPKVLAALADPARLATVQTLARVGESPCGRIQHDAGLVVSKSTMSHHLRILREAGIIASRVEGSRRMLTLRRDDLQLRFPGLLDAVLSAEREPAGVAN